MSNSKATATANGIGIFGLLTVALIVLKLIGILPDVGWLWIILLPIYGPILAFIAIVGITLLLAGTVFVSIYIYEKVQLWVRERRRRKELNRLAKVEETVETERES